MRNPALALSLLLLLPAFAAEEEFSSLKEAEKVFEENFSSQGDWNRHSISRGQTTRFVDERVFYDYDRNVVGRDFEMYSSNTAGTIMAFPVGDFREVFSFKYRQGRSVKDGLVVAAKVQISIPSSSGSAGADALQRTVENMVKSGCCLSSAVGAKPCRFFPLRKSVAKRFGASGVHAIYDVEHGYILFVLGGLDPKKADETFLPATRQGVSASERKKAKALARQKDTSSIVHGYRKTVFYPAGTDPSRYVDLYDESLEDD